MKKYTHVLHMILVATYFNADAIYFVNVTIRISDIHFGNLLTPQGVLPLLVVILLFSGRPRPAFRQKGNSSNKDSKSSKSEHSH